MHPGQRRAAATLSWLAVAASVSLTGSAIATATPSRGVSVVTLSQTTVDGTDYITREITIAPGGSTGWHYHDPTVYGLIRSGTLTRTLGDCQVDGTYPAGSAVAEGQGPGHVHVGRNLGTEPLVMWVSYVAPTGTPASVDVPDPGCGFA
jgi:quercetin dioxygenase-like cupin family protein